MVAHADGAELDPASRTNGSASEVDPFFVGFAMSVYQSAGDPRTNWGDFEK